MLKLTMSVLPSIALAILLQHGPPDQSVAAHRHDPSLLVYDFNLHMGPEGNVDHVKSLGFKGLVTSVQVPADLLKLSQYAGYVETIPNFDLLAFVNYDFTNPASSQVWREALPILASVDAPLWVILKGAPSAAAVPQLLEQMATESQAAGVQTVIYPHWTTDIESAAEASALINAIGHPNLKSSLHTCHEIRAGNQYTLDAVVSMHAPVSALVTIAGAEENAYAGPFDPFVDWSDAILPLDKGDFSLLPFLQALHDSGYDGPVILHTFGITGDPGHLQASLGKYAEYLEQLTQ
jgi:sugar phosphate isomerase/epimerase